MTASGWLMAVLGVLATLLGQASPGVGLIAAGLFLSVVVNLRSFRRWTIRRRGRSFLGMTVELTIGEDGLRTVTPDGTGHIAWSGMTDVREDPRTVLFLRDRLALAYAPAAAFGSLVRRRQVLDYARAQIASAARTPTT